MLYITSVLESGPPELNDISMSRQLGIFVFTSYFVSYLFLNVLILIKQPEKDATIPRFGAWNEKNPSDAEGFTEIFNKAREDKHNGTDNWPRVQPGATPSPYNNYRERNESDGPDGCLPFLKVSGKFFRSYSFIQTSDS